ncbi:fungal-specific transcription factor domain-containing protein [Mycena sp. CBHHK59/15]|nr:fungal-specific transcription factor domain-containing protein [Mycena sp. CBHHK59/15]
MPQAAKKDATSQRAQEKESKRARGALSCAECRRLKLKCDKTVPCSSCKRRGCSAICPNGSLITGQGTRFVLADTEKLHTKIATMSDRIRHLEDALAVLQSTVTSEPHPLLARDLLQIKSSIELHAAVEGDDGGGGGGAQHDDEDVRDGELEEYIDAFGTLAIRDDGAATFYGRSAGSESLLMGESPSPSPSPVIAPASTNTSPATSHAHASLAALSASFPFSGAARPGVDLPALAARLPPPAEGRRLCALYLAQAPWFFGAVTPAQLGDEVVPRWFPEDDAAAAATPIVSNGTGTGSAHELALVFVILCFGALGDTRLPFPGAAAHAGDEGELDGEGKGDSGYYYRLTKAALALEPVLEGPPSVATVQTLALMAIYEGLCAGENSIESTWAIFGLSTKLAQSIGLHRDCARWGLKPAEVQKRRALFWELFITDCWQALATGRLPTFSLPFVDCELPQDVGQAMTDDGKTQSSFPYWKARFGAECVSAVVQGTLTSRAPRYPIILELDRKVRDMELPQYAVGPAPVGCGLSETMSHFMPTNYRHLTLLYIHRCFFAHAISNHPHDPIKSPYAPSFLAGYRSACELLSSLRLQFNAFPAEIARFWVLWTHAFSSAIMLSSVVTHATHSKVAPAALLELSKACELFEAASGYGGRAGRFLPILQRVSKRAVQVFEDARNGAPPVIPNNIFEPSRPDATDDELSIFSGKTHTLTTKAKPARPLQPSTPSTSSSRAMSDPPAQAFTDNPSFAGVHPSLINELEVFDGQISAQIQNGYYPNGVFAQPPIVQAQHEQEHYRLQQGQAQYQQQLLEHEEYRRQQRQQHQAEELRLRQQQAQQHQLEYAYQGTPPQAFAYSHPHGVPASAQDVAHAQHTLAHSSSQRSLRQAYQHQHSHSNSHAHQPHTLVHTNPQTNMRHAAPMPPSRSLSQEMPRAPPEMPPRGLAHSHSHRSLRQAYDAQRPEHEQYSAYRHPADVDTGSVSPPAHMPDGIYVDESPTHSPYQALNPHCWPAPGYAPPEYDMRDQQQHRHRLQLDQHQQQLRQINLQLGQPQPGHYTPDGALRGIAAEDSRLQEHWQTYMSKVGSPRMIQDA